MSHADGRLAGIATDNDKLHAFAKVIGQGAHGASLLCLSMILFPFETEVRAFLNRQPPSLLFPLCLLEYACPAGAARVNSQHNSKMAIPCRVSSRAPPCTPSSRPPGPTKQCRWI